VLAVFVYQNAVIELGEKLRKPPESRS
jgi:hypothetical protein